MESLPVRFGEAYDKAKNVGGRKNRAGTGNLREQVIHQLPTPTVSDQYTANLTSTQQSEGSLHSVTLAQIVNRPDLLPTPMTTDYKQTDCQNNWNRHSPPLGTIVHDPWGRFEPAIRRWETVLGRPAPSPTNPDGKDGNHRLSSKFTEWMMGLPEGWITDAGLTRNEELKACGNGVVPQQAELALRMLLK
jgi:DNA (cytosine-5)-methyltransferase 1